MRQKVLSHGFSKTLSYGFHGKGPLTVRRLIEPLFDLEGIETHLSKNVR